MRSMLERRSDGKLFDLGRYGGVGQWGAQPGWFAIEPDVVLVAAVLADPSPLGGDYPRWLDYDEWQVSEVAGRVIRFSSGTEVRVWRSGAIADADESLPIVGSRHLTDDYDADGVWRDR